MRTRLLTPRSAVALALILLLAAVFRLVVSAHAPAFPTHTDSVEYFTTAYSLVQTGQLDLPIKRPPLYALFLAPIIAAFGPSLEAVALVQHVVGLLTVVLVYLLGALAFGRVVGLIAAGVTAVNGSLLLMEHSITSEALFTPLLLACLIVFLLALRTSKGWLFLLSGLLLGLGALARPPGQLILPLLALAALLAPLPGGADMSSRWANWRPRLLTAGLVCLGFVLVVGPWVARNRAVHGVSSISSGLGDSLFSRVSRYDPGFSLKDRTTPREDHELARLRNRIVELSREHEFPGGIRDDLKAEFGLTELQSEAAMRDFALLIIRQEPERYLTGSLAFALKLGLGFQKDFEDFWEVRAKPKYARLWPEPLRWIRAPIDPWTDQDKAIADAATDGYQDYKLGGLLLSIFFLAGTVACLAGWRRGLWLLPAIIAFQLLVHVALNGPLYRYRYPLQPLITLVSAAGLALLAEQVWALARRIGVPSGLSSRRVGARPPEHAVAE